MKKSIIAIQTFGDTVDVYTINVPITVTEAYDLLGQAMALAADDGNLDPASVSSAFCELFINKECLFEQGDLCDAVIPNWGELELLIWIFGVHDMRVYIDSEKWKFANPITLQLTDIPMSQRKGA